MPAFHRRAPRLSSVSRKAGAPGDGDEPTKRGSSKCRISDVFSLGFCVEVFILCFVVVDADSETKFDDTVDEIQKALGKSFGGTLWFAVLLTLLAIFGGGYVYLIYNYADFSDIPILNGAKGL